MVAMRPQAISPQYLTMIHASIHDIMPNRLQFNLISGHIKPFEKDFGGLIGEITDESSHVLRSNYLIEYMKEIYKMQEYSKDKDNWPAYGRILRHIPDTFISVTNEYVFETAEKLGYKMIIPYREYKQGHWTEYEAYQSDNGATFPGKTIHLRDNTIMLHLCPVIRETQEELEALGQDNRSNDTEYFTYDQFNDFVKQLELQGIEHLMLNPGDSRLEERPFVLKAVKQLTTTDIVK